MPIMPRTIEELKKNTESYDQKINILDDIVRVPLKNKIDDILFKLDESPTWAELTILDTQLSTLERHINRTIRKHHDSKTRTHLIPETQKEGTSHYETLQMESYKILRENISNMQHDIELTLRSMPHLVVFLEPWLNRYSTPPNPDNPSDPIPISDIYEYQRLATFVTESQEYHSLDARMFDPSVDILDKKKKVDTMKKLLFDVSTLLKRDAFYYYDANHPFFCLSTYSGPPPFPTENIFKTTKDRIERHYWCVQSDLKDKEREIVGKSFLPYARTKNYGRRTWRAWKPKAVQATKWVWKQSWRATKGLGRWMKHTGKFLWKRSTLPLWWPVKFVKWLYSSPK